MKYSKPLVAMVIAATLATAPPVIAAPKTILKAAGRAVTTVVNTILSGAGIPAKATGIDGDFYIDTKNANLYGPKTKGTWKIATSLKQPEPKSVSSASGEQVVIGPTGAQGEKGDKGATGNTGAPGSAGLPGAAGAKGDAGTAGAKGDAGTAGAKGDAGTAGAAGASGVSNSKFSGFSFITFDTGVSGNNRTSNFVTITEAGNYTFEVLASATISNDENLNFSGEIVSGGLAIDTQYSISSAAILGTSPSLSRRYSIHILGVASEVAVGTSFGIKITLGTLALSPKSISFGGRALINKVGSIG